MCGRENKKSVFTRTPNPVKGQKLFEGKRIYCSDITGFGVRPFPDLVFEVERILHRATDDIVLPGCSASSTIACFCAADQSRRRSTDVITSTDRKDEERLIFAECDVTIGETHLSPFLTSA